MMVAYFWPFWAHKYAAPNQTKCLFFPLGVQPDRLKLWWMRGNLCSYLQLTVTAIHPTSAHNALLRKQGYEHFQLKALSLGVYILYIHGCLYFLVTSKLVGILWEGIKCKCRFVGLRCSCPSTSNPLKKTAMGFLQLGKQQGNPLRNVRWMND